MSTAYLSSFRNLIFMLEKRGYDISLWESLKGDLKESDFINKINELKNTTLNHQLVLQNLQSNKKNIISTRNSLSFITQHKTTQELVLVFFADKGTNSSITSDQITMLISLIAFIENNSSYRLNNIIILGTADIHTVALGQLNLNKGSRFIQFFLDKEISSDPTEYDWGSKIEVYDKIQSDNFFTENNLTPNLIPCIPIEDAVLKYLGVQKGLIVKFTRQAFIPDLIEKETIVYRYTYEKPKDKKK